MNDSSNDGQKLSTSAEANESTSSKSQRVLHWLGWAEGISWLVLLLVAVPLKYLAGNPSLVKSMGPLHGGLFVGLLMKCLHSLTMGELKFRQVLAIMGASFIPFGPFLIDRVLDQSKVDS